MFEIRSERLVIRPNRASDVPAFHAMATDWDVVRNTSSWPWPPDVTFTAQRCEPMSVDEGLAGAVLLGNQIIGGMGIHERGMGYMFHRDYWGQGYATEIGMALITAYFDRFAATQIEADVWVDNPASQRVLQKLGFEVTGRSRKTCAAQAKTVDAVNFCLTRQRWDHLRNLSQ